MKRAQSSITSEITPQHVLADLFDSDGFPVPIPDSEAAAEIGIQRLTDAGFEIRPRSEAAEEIAGYLPIGPPRIVPGGPARFTPRGQT
jgi:hypothetical protein